MKKGSRNGLSYTMAYQCYTAQKYHSIDRGIAFEFSFDEWVMWWVDHLGARWLERRGRRKHQFCMARKGDYGPYAEWNVMCILNSQNGSDRAANGTAGNYGGNGLLRKLTERQAAEIFLAKGNHKVIGQKYGVTAQTVKNIKTRHTWRKATEQFCK